MSQKILEKIDSPKDLQNLNNEDLAVLAQEIRDVIIDVVSTNPGHLASNLGVVELTIALHRSFDFLKDKLVWDVGHQTYVHKLLTGRRKEFPTLRQYKGLSGFPDIKESKYDPFICGHSGNTLSRFSSRVVVCFSKSIHRAPVLPVLSICFLAVPI